MKRLRFIYKLARGQTFNVTLDLWTVTWVAIALMIAGELFFNIGSYSDATASAVCVRAYNLAMNTKNAYARISDKPAASRGLDLTFTSGNARFKVQCADTGNEETCSLQSEQKP